MNADKFDVIAIVSPVRKLELQRSEEGRRLLRSDGILVDTKSNLQVNYPELAQQLASQRIAVGEETLLVRDPYSPMHLYLVENAPLLTATRYLGAVTTVCRQLGASSISCEYLEVETNSANVRVDANGGTLSATGSLSTESERLANKLGRIFTNTDFGAPVPPDIETAKQTAHSRGIINDPTIETLIDIAPLGAQKHAVVLELAESSRKVLKLAATACVPGTAWVGLRVSLEHASSTIIRIKIVVHFVQSRS